ncbi:MAG: class I SAM-dependent methyltransferase [bacterium]|nr:class I SAM-dependent methyltransferase [bacterium]
MDLAALLREAPAFHTDEGWNPVSLQASDEVLHLLAATVRPGMHTLETGAGMSTVVFAAAGAVHTCVTPADGEVGRIRAWCAGHGVDLARTTFRTQRSETALPRLAATPLDVVLIDGGHGFPTPFIDWFYTADRLRVGGTLVVDDVHLWTGAVLRDFLAAEPAWRLRDEFAERAAVFEKVATLPALPEWTHQPFVVRRSRVAGTPARVLRRALGVVRRDGLAALWRGARGR